LLGELQRRTHGWLDLSAAARRLCGASDDALDALVAALVARHEPTLEMALDAPGRGDAGDAWVVSLVNENVTPTAT
jgi:hypothetical protein